jgi:hypothetical protein
MRIDEKVYSELAKEVVELREQNEFYRNDNLRLYKEDEEKDLELYCFKEQLNKYIQTKRDLLVKNDELEKMNKMLDDNFSIALHEINALEKVIKEKDETIALISKFKIWNKFIRIALKSAIFFRIFFILSLLFSVNLFHFIPQYGTLKKNERSYTWTLILFCRQ